MVATDIGRDVDTWKRVSTKAPIDFEVIREARERAAEVDPPDWLADWPDCYQEPAPPGCTKSGCTEPVAPRDALYCAAHRAEAGRVVMPWELPAAMKGAET